MITNTNSNITEFHKDPNSKDPNSHRLGNKNTGPEQREITIAAKSNAGFADRFSLKTAQFGDNQYHRINLSSAAKFLQKVNKGGLKAIYYLKLLFMSPISRKNYLNKHFVKLTPSRFNVIDGRISYPLEVAKQVLQPRNDSGFAREEGIAIAANDKNAVTVQLSSGQTAKVLLNKEHAPIDIDAPLPSIFHYVEEMKAKLKKPTSIVKALLKAMTPKQRGELLLSLPTKDNCVAPYRPRNDGKRLEPIGLDQILHKGPRFATSTEKPSIEVIINKQSYRLILSSTARFLNEQLELAQEGQQAIEDREKQFILSKLQKLDARGLGTFLESIEELYDAARQKALKAHPSNLTDSRSSSPMARTSSSEGLSDTVSIDSFNKELQAASTYIKKEASHNKVNRYVTTGLLAVGAAAALASAPLAAAAAVTAAALHAGNSYLKA